MSGPICDPGIRYDGLLSGGAMVAGVIGHPIGHSLSPRLHGAWIRALGLDAAYVPLHTTPDTFERTVRALTGGAFRGFNVTLPFKERALALADEATDRATASGAANVIVYRQDGTLLADNTDGEGLLYALRRQAPGWRPDRGPVTVIGAGGAARGAVAALAAAGTTEIRILNRTRARADTLSALLPCIAYGWDDAAAAFDGAATVINATSGQLTGDAPLPLPPASQGGIVVMDMVYKPLETPFLAACRTLGHQTVDGLDMLIGQGIPAFTAFYGVAPPDLPVRDILLAAMVPRSGGMS